MFLDEIQKSPDAIQSLWTFKEDYPELHVVAAGSLLEFALQELPSFGVGRIRSLFVYPFSFDEFLAAEGKAAWVTAKQEASAEKPLLTPLYNDLVQHFRTFLMVGGMPASVAAWVSTHDYSQCQAELNDIQLTYYDDFPKYAKKVDPTLLRNTLQSVVMDQRRKWVGKFVFPVCGLRTQEARWKNFRFAPSLPSRAWVPPVHMATGGHGFSTRAPFLLRPDHQRLCISI